MSLTRLDESAEMFVLIWHNLTAFQKSILNDFIATWAWVQISSWLSLCPVWKITKYFYLSSVPKYYFTHLFPFQGTIYNFKGKYWPFFPVHLSDSGLYWVIFYNQNVLSCSKNLLHCCRLNYPKVFKQLKWAPPPTASRVEYYLHSNVSIIMIKYYKILGSFCCQRVYILIILLYYVKNLGSLLPPWLVVHIIIISRITNMRLLTLTIDQVCVHSL